MKKLTIGLCAAMAAMAGPVLAESDPEIQELKQRIEQLEKQLNQKLNAMADAVEKNQQSTGFSNRVHFGGYGEMHYNHLDVDGEDERELDFHRMVLFFGYDFNEKARFVTEFEIEHIIASSGNRGAVEVEQAYIEFDLANNMHLQTGALLMPVGIINETHEPTTFYGVERPIVETTVIPTTWWSNGIKFIHKLENGISYDLMLSEGLKTEDPNADVNAEPFNIKAGKQKGSFADAFDLAVTGRIRYTGVKGLELALYGQYQPDLDQSAEESYAEDATLVGGHIIYQWQQITTKALYARWDLAGDAAEAAGKDVQDGGYIEMAWQPLEHWGFFARQSVWSLEDDIEAEQTDVGVNFYPYEGIVFKANYQLQNDDAGNADGFSLGMGYAF